MQKKHPPVIIERFLFVLLSIGSLISGYTMAVKKEGDWFLTLLYLGLMGFALYVIFSLEYPHELQNLQVINADFLKLQKSWQ
jgi:Ca2+/Na+ antiporter